MNITESNDWNMVLSWIIPNSLPTFAAATSEQAMEAAARLAERAYKPLGAGLRAEDVRAAWPNEARRRAVVELEQHRQDLSEALHGTPGRIWSELLASAAWFREEAETQGRLRRAENRDVQTQRHRADKAEAERDAARADLGQTQWIAKELEKHRDAYKADARAALTGAATGPPLVDVITAAIVMHLYPPDEWPDGPPGEGEHDRAREEAKAIVRAITGAPEPGRETTP